jgi:type IV secretory pathway TraG/TraD family ATPase VirD4
MILFSNKTKLTPENVRFLKSLGYKVFLYNKKDGRYSRRFNPYSIRQQHR